MKNWFTSHPFLLKRLKTHEVKIGNLLMGSQVPVRIQSMVNTSTHNVSASVNQAIEIIDAGGELVRFAVINLKDAEALKDIKNQLIEKGYNNPLVADVHFNPELADVAAKYIDKVRINPGNYLDKRATFANIEFTNDEYEQELNRLEQRFVSFLTICKENKTAVRIGTNHGSLSDRIMSRYGDTPEGMVEATMEFLRICKKHEFYNVVVSLKSSNTRIMVYAYRLLVRQMQKEKMTFALHLGVTEAGSEDDGRIKSAVGIGSLMHDGLGDTIRVSLTEHPAKEISVAKKLVTHFQTFENKGVDINGTLAYNAYSYQKRKTQSGIKKPLVVADLAAENEICAQNLIDLGFVFDEKTQGYKGADLSPDAVFVGEHIMPFRFTDETLQLVDGNYWQESPNVYPLFSLDEYFLSQRKSPVQNWVQIAFNQLTDDFISYIKGDSTMVLVCFSFHKNYTAEIRALINLLLENDIKNPLVIQQNYTEINTEDFQLKSAADTGLFFIDGLASGLWLKNTFKKSNKQLVETAFGILQASRTRITKTDYISCPGCGRTLFELEITLQKIKRATQHLKGLKIAVMGCIVNGPGEMADADYGYVGAGPGKVSLYKGKELVMRDIDVEDAVNKLLVFIENDLG